jgi:membrane protein implicated in regulation of membrane protease activity
MVWLIGIALVLGVLAVPFLWVGLLIASALYFVAVMILCFRWGRELNANVDWMEDQLSNTRYGTVTERNLPPV